MLNISGLLRIKLRKLFSSSILSFTNSGLKAPFLTHNELFSMNWINEIERPKHSNSFSKAVKIGKSTTNFLVCFVELESHFVNHVIVKNSLFDERMTYDCGGNWQERADSSFIVFRTQFDLAIVCKSVGEILFV